MAKLILTIILSRELGTRLREETEYLLIPMIPIGGKPILWQIMKIFARFSHSDFILPLAYWDMIKEYFYYYTPNDSPVQLPGCEAL